MRPPEIIDGNVVAIFGGSFDPISFAHLHVAAEVISFGLADQVWMVPCGMRPDKPTVALPRLRLEMATVALNDIFPPSVPIYVDSTEADSGRYIPTRELMNMYRSKYPSLRFKILMGDDLISSLHWWDDFPQLVSENSFVVYPRATGYAEPSDEAVTSIPLNDANRTTIHVERLSNSLKFHAIFSSASSTEIRRRIQSSGGCTKTIIGLTPWAVIAFIQEHSLYL